MESHSSKDRAEAMKRAGESDNQWLERRLCEQRDERRRALADAKKSAAAEGKEPFDLEKLGSLWDFSPQLADASWEPTTDTVFALEYKYYVRYPQCQTLAAFAERMIELDPYR